MEVQLWNAIWKKYTVSLDKDDPILCALDQAVKHMDMRSIIELGSGSGLRTLLLATKYRMEATLVDFSPEAMRVAKCIATRLNYNRRVRYVQQDVLSQKFFEEFKQQYFDIVWSGGLNEHFAGVRRQKIFNIMASLCKAGGKVIVIVPNRVSTLYWILRAYSKMKDTWKVGYEEPFSPNELMFRMKRACLKRVRVKGLDWRVGSLFQKQVKISAEPVRKILEKSFQSELLYGEGVK